MKTSYNQDRDFIKEIIPSDLLEQSIQYIVNNFQPEEIYGDDKMHEWAKDNGYILEE